MRILLKRGEATGLGVALALHAGLVAVLLMQPERNAVLPPPPERMTVSLATDVGLEATAPDPVPVSRAATAPALAPEPAPEVAQEIPEQANAPQSEPEPQPQPQPLPQPQQPAPHVPREPEPRATARPQPRPSPSPRVAARPPPERTPTTPARPAPAPERSPAPLARPAPAAKPAPAQTTAARPAPAAKRAPSQSAAVTPPASTPKRGGGSRIGSDFLPGTGSSETSSEPRPVAAAFGATEQAALSAAINRQLKPHWRAPQGLDADQLVTVLTWELNENGSLKGRPRIVSQSGINDSNRPQAELHAEQAIRAVQLAAPFDLPPQFHEKWRRIRDWRFDRRL